MTEVVKLNEKVMPKRFRPYAEYRDSSVTWLGAVPSHWDVKRTKFVATLQSGHTPSRQKPEYWKDCTIPWFGLADVWQIRDGKVEYVHVTEEKISEIGLANSAARLLPKETVILSRTASVGFSAILGVSMATTQDFANWICGPSIRPEYLLFVFRSMDQEFRRLTMGSTHQTIYMPDVAGFSTVVPPVPEQEKIVAYIRSETAKIDALLEQKQRLINLLREKRTALITRAVTQGLDPNVPMKDSGIQWLGEIPAHWSLARWRYCCRIAAGQIAPEAEHFRDMILIAPNHVESGTGRVLYTQSADEQGAISGKYLVAPGDIIYSKIRPALNKLCVATGSWLCSADMYPVSITDTRLRTRFLVYFMLSERFVRLMVDESMRVAMPKVNRDTLSGCSILVPPPAEQRAIVAFLDHETGRIDALTAKAHEAIDHLNELRAALITAAVTGRVDVRGAAPR